MDLDGSLTPLTQDGFGDSFPSWAPDWTVLAFASESRTPSTTRSIWTLDAYTGVLTQVTDDSTSDDRPTWSPDGSKIAFQSAGRGGSSPSIWMIELATSVLTRITDDAGSDDRPAWSPDGTKIAFESGDRGGALSPSIWTVEVASGVYARLTNDDSDDFEPAWAPDGSRVAFHSLDRSDPASWCIWSVDGDTGDLTQLTDTAFNDFDPAWSPDGTQIAFYSEWRVETIPNSIVTKDLSASLDLGYTAVTSDSGLDTAPNWPLSASSTPTPPSSGAVTVTVSDTQGRAGGTVTVPVGTTDVTGLELIGVTFTIAYDPALLTPTNDGVATTAGALGPVLSGSGSWLVEQNVPTPGQRNIALAGDPAAGVGELLTVTFDIAAGAAAGATSPLTLTQSSLNEGEIAVTVANGTFSVLTLVYGDVTGNGAATSFDAAWVLNYVVNAALSPPNIVPFRIEESAPTWSATPVTAEVAFEVADVDADAALTAMDAALILQYDVALIVSFPAEAAPAPSRGAVGPVTYRLRGGSSTLRPGGRMVVSLDADAVDSLYAGEARLDFDSRTLRLVGVAVGGTSAGRGRPAVTYQARDGQVVAAFASARPLGELGAALEFEFEVTGDVNARVTGEVRASRVRLNGVLAGSDAAYAYSVEPYSFRLMANYPNPFNPETWIPFELAEDADVTVRIYDLRGGLVRSLHLGSLAAGEYLGRSRAARWDGANAAGEAVSSGVYAYELRAGGVRETRRMVVRK
jgi:hypothetical protein